MVFRIFRIYIFNKNSKQKNENKNEMYTEFGLKNILYGEFQKIYFRCLNLQFFSEIKSQNFRF